MRKILLLSLFLVLIFSSSRAVAQDIVYRDTFRNGVPATTAQITRWNDFRAKLLSNLPYVSMKISGTNDQTGIICTDPTITKDFANALRTVTTYISSTTNGHVWSICNRYLGEVWIDPPSSCSGSNCPNPGYIIRPGIGTGNQNWGGINSATCGGPNQWMELRFVVVPPFNWNIATVGIDKPDPCTVKQDIKATFENSGKKDIDSFQYYVKVNSTTYGPTWAKTKIASGKQANITVYSGYSFVPSTAYNITVWTDKPNNQLDSFRKNDTFSYSFGFNGTKGVPTAKDTAVCGSQIVTLKATPDLPGDSLAWFSDRTLNAQIGSGKTYTTKYLSSGAKYKFYVASYNGFIKGALALGYTLTNGWPSCMFDIKSPNTDLTIDSIGLNIYDVNFSVGTSLTVEVYMREGSFNDPGATTTGSMWTKIYSGPVISRGSQRRSTCFVKFDIGAGKNYSIYINPTQTGSNTILAKPSSSTISNSDISITGGTLNQINFGTALTGYTIDGEIFYRKMLCKSAPDSIELNVKPAPYGSKLDPGMPFQVAPKNGGTGVAGKPHVVAMGDTLAFDLRTPTGYNNADHGSTWSVKNVSVKSLSGRAITSYTWADPVSGSSSKPGRLVYTPTTTDIDSVLEIQVSMQDLGPNFCDTLIKHYVYVAPLPEPDFTRNIKVCDGEVVEFTNASKILKGFIDYKWYFGTGDSSEATDPIYQFPTYGTYYVKLNAISSIYGYVRTKIDTLVVTQIPKVAFKVNNACEKQTHTFTNQTTVNAGALSYQWNFGDGPGVQSTLKDPSHKYAATGQYKVTLTATANGCAASLTKNAYLFPKPKAVFTYPKGANDKYCTNNNVNFSNSSTISSGNMGSSWYFGDGERGTVTNPTHGYKTAGDFNVMLISISEFGCADTAKDVVKVGGAPVVSFTNSQVCDQTPTQFTNTTPAVSGTTANTTWSFGDGNTSTANSPQHQYMTLGPKNVKLVVRLDNGCRDSVSKTLNVGTQAVTDFSVENTCSGKPVQFENKTTYSQGNIVYKWNFGPDSSSIADPVYTYNVMASTTYNVTLTATVDGGCVSSTTKPITVYELPNSSFSLTDDWTPGEGYRTVRVTAANNTYPFYRFKFSDGGSINTSTGLYQFPYEGDFTVTLCVRNQADCESCQTLSKAIRNPLGVTTQTAGDVRIYPNPSSGVVNVSASSELKQITVYNVLGDEVSVSSELQGKTGRIVFNNVSEGIYLVKVTTAAGSSTSRITINK